MPSLMIPSSAPVSFAAAAVSSVPRAARPSSPKPLIASRQPSALEPVFSSALPRGPVSALLRERLLCCDAEFAELDEKLITCEDRVLKLESSRSAAAQRRQSFALRSSLCKATSPLLVMTVQLRALL